MFASNAFIWLRISLDPIFDFTALYGNQTNDFIRRRRYRYARSCRPEIHIFPNLKPMLCHCLPFVLHYPVGHFRPPLYRRAYKTPTPYITRKKVRLAKGLLTQHCRHAKRPAQSTEPKRPDQFTRENCSRTVLCRNLLKLSSEIIEIMVAPLGPA